MDFENDIIIFDGGGGVAHFSALRHRRYKLKLEEKYAKEVLHLNFEF